MKEEMFLLNQKPFTLRVARDVVARLGKTCFGNLGGNPSAGKFARWPTIETLLRDPLFMVPFLERLQAEFDTLNRDGEAKLRFSFDLNEPIGWDTTAPRDGIGREELEEHFPNIMTGGLAVKANSKRKAPLTNLITVACKVSANGFIRFADIYSINPGFDIGWISANNEPRGDVTAKLGRVFFPFGHPGTELAAA